MFLGSVLSNPNYLSIPLSVDMIAIKCIQLFFHSPAEQVPNLFHRDQFLFPESFSFCFSLDALAGIRGSKPLCQTPILCTEISQLLSHSKLLFLNEECSVVLP